MRKLVYQVAVSIDGFIALPDGSTDRFPQTPAVLTAVFGDAPETCPAHLRAALGVTRAPRRFDTVVMGARTHQPALDAGLTSAYPHLRQYVVTHRRDLPPDPTVTPVHEDPVSTVRGLKTGPGLDIWLCGGADLAGQLADEIDEVRLKVYPVAFGDGIPLWRGGAPRRALEAVSVEDLADGAHLTVYRFCDGAAA